MSMEGLSKPQRAFHLRRAGVLRQTQCGGRGHRHSAREKGALLTVALLAYLYVSDVEADEHAVLLILCSLILVVAQGSIQPQGKPIPLPAAEDGACAIFQTHQAG